MWMLKAFPTAAVRLDLLASTVLMSYVMMTVMDMEVV